MEAIPPREENMAHALETRAPFLESARGRGPKKRALVGDKPVGKRVLCEAFRDRLPAEVFAWPKRGFEMPVEQLLAGPAAARLAAATISSRSIQLSWMAGICQWWPQ